MERVDELRRLLRKGSAERKLFDGR